MEHRTKRDLALINLVSSFEENFNKGKTEYFEEKDYSRLISYYEEECLYDKAIDAAFLAISQYKYRAEFYIALSRLLFNVNRTEEALKYIEAAENVAPFETEVYLLKAMALAKIGHHVEATDCLDKVRDILIDESNTDYMKAASFVFEQNQDIQDAYDLICAVLRKEPLDLVSLDKLQYLNELGKLDKENILFLNELLNANPYNHMAWYNLGLSLSNIGDYAEAIDALEYSFIVDASFEFGYVECAALCLQEKEYARAASIYRDAISVIGDDIDLMLGLAEALFAQGYTTKAKQYLYKSIKLDPYNEEVYYMLGQCFYQEKKWYRAINSYLKAIELEDTCETFYLGLARAYLKVENYNKATKNFQIAVSLGPELSEFWSEFVSFLIRLGLYDEALQILDEAEDHTYGADLLVCRGIVYYFTQKKSLGINMLEEALEEDPLVHTLIYKLAPELELNTEIRAMVKYFLMEE